MADPQLSLLPFASPANVLLHMHQLTNRIQKMEPDLSAEHSIRLLNELAMVAALLDSIHAALVQETAARVRRLGIIV